MIVKFSLFLLSFVIFFVINTICFNNSIIHEIYINKGKYKVSQHITRIIISHRLSIIRDCDEIIIMKDGQILDSGTHDELIKRCEYYQALIINE